MWRLSLLLAATVLAQDALPPRAVARLGSPRLYNPQGVSAGAISPDGRLLALASAEGGLRVWEADTGSLAWASVEPCACANAIGFDAAGERLYTVRHGEDEVSCWDARTGVLLPDRAIRLAARPTVGAAFSAGRIATNTENGGICVHDLASRRMIWCRSYLNGAFECVAISADGSQVAAADAEGLVAVFGPDGREVWRNKAEDAARTALAFSADGSRLAAGTEGGGVQVFDAATGAVRADIEGEENWILSIGFSPDGSRVVTGADDGMIQAWEPGDGRKTWSLRYIPDPLFFVKFFPDGSRVAVGSEIGAVRYLDPATGQDETPGEGHLDPVVALAFSPDGGSLVSGGLGGGLIVWDLATSKPIWRKAHGRFGVLSVAFEPEGAAVWVTDGAAVHGREADDGSHSWCRLEDPERLRAAVLFEDGSRVAAVPYDEVPGVWRSAGGERELTLVSPTVDQPSRVAVSTDGSIVVLAGEAGVQLLIVRGRRVADAGQLPGLRGVSEVAFTPDDRFCAVLTGARVQLYELAGAEFPIATVDPRGRPTSIAFCGDARTLLVGGADGVVDVYDTRTGGRSASLAGHTGAVLALAVSRDGRRVASGSADRTVCLWDMTGIHDSRGAPASLDAAWRDLATSDLSYAALWALVEAGDDAVSFLVERVSEARVEGARIESLVRQLDADDFEEREAATKALSDLGSDAAPALEAALKESPSAEVRSRAEKLLISVGGLRISSMEALRGVRAVAALEHIGTPAARELLARLAAGAPESRLTREARSALKRLDRRSAR